MHQFECVSHVLNRPADDLQASGHSLGVTTPHTIDHRGNILQSSGSVRNVLALRVPLYLSVNNNYQVHILGCFLFLMYLHLHRRNSSQLHQQSDQEETSGTFSTREADQQLQVPV